MSAFLANLREKPGLPPGWESEMVDRVKPHEDKDGKSSKSSDKRFSGPDKEGKPVRGVRTVKHAWLVHGGFASGESACQALNKQLKEYKESVVAAAPPAAGAPGPSSENGVDASDREEGRGRVHRAHAARARGTNAPRSSSW